MIWFIKEERGGNNVLIEFLSRIRTPSCSRCVAAVLFLVCLKFLGVSNKRGSRRGIFSCWVFVSLKCWDS